MRTQSIGLVILLVALLIGVMLHYYSTKVNFHVVSPKVQTTSTFTHTAALPHHNSKITFPIDINTASFEELIALPQIGPTLAQRIINWRNKYGPINSYEDLLQIKGISKHTLKKFIHLLYIPTSTQTNSTQVKVKLYQDRAEFLPDQDRTEFLQNTAEFPNNKNQTKVIDINNATIDQLILLPDIGEVKARAIVKWREEHGSFTNLQQLLNVKGIGQKTLTKIIPYITIQNYSTTTTDTAHPLSK